MSFSRIQPSRAVVILAGFLSTATILGIASVVEIGGESVLGLLFSDKHLGKLYNDIVRDTLLNPWFYLPVLFILMLERIRPAERSQKLLSPGFMTDFIYYILDIIAEVFVLAAWVMATRWFYDHALWYLTIDSIQ